MTGGADGKVKLWNTQTGFCFVTFTNHTGPVQAVAVSPSNSVVLSASRDGTVRAYDLLRYRNFRTLFAASANNAASLASAATAPAAQLQCLAIDGAGEVIAAGGIDPYSVFVWNLQTGTLTDELAGHTGPITAVQFVSQRNFLLSASLDNTVRMWDLYGGNGCVDIFQHTSSVVCMAARPDGKQLITATLDGQLHCWSLDDAHLLFSMDCKRDLRMGRSAASRLTAESLTKQAHFTSICYSADGNMLLAGGNSNTICIYHLPTRLLVRSLPMTKNRSFANIVHRLNSKNLKASGGALVGEEEIDDATSGSEKEDRIDRSLPGAKSLEKRRTPPMSRVHQLSFSSTGQHFAVASTLGLLMYSLNGQLSIDAGDLGLSFFFVVIFLSLASSFYSSELTHFFLLNSTGPHTIRMADCS